MKPINQDNLEIGDFLAHCAFGDKVDFQVIKISLQQWRGVKLGNHATGGVVWVKWPQLLSDFEFSTSPLVRSLVRLDKDLARSLPGGHDPHINPNNYQAIADRDKTK